MRIHAFACPVLDLAWQVGAPPEVATLLEEIGRERCAAAAAGGEVGLDPELDEFMVRQAGSQWHVQVSCSMEWP